MSFLLIWRPNSDSSETPGGHFLSELGQHGARTRARAATTAGSSGSYLSAAMAARSMSSTLRPYGDAMAKRCLTPLRLVNAGGPRTRALTRSRGRVLSAIIDRIACLHRKLRETL
jgi:hypothetical protein